MAKTCYDCRHMENNGSNEPGEISGWVCGNLRREPKTIEEERRFDKNWASEAYRNRYKRCFESTPTTDAPQAKGSEVGNEPK